VGENSRITSSSSQKFLAISAGQLAMSLENLDLLEEARAAYARLKELQDETIQLEKMATRGEMSAEIGHELNNFVGVVAGNLSLLEFHLKKQNYDDLDKYVRTMQDTIENIKKFTANLMELTPISSKKEVIQFERLLVEVIDYLKPQRRFRDVTIECDDVETPIPFEADSVHIQQLLYNLFNNAADATARSDRRNITVSMTRCDKQDKFVFSISDTGSGIDPDYLTKAFREKFTTKKDGHGFGLLVCSRIIESHGGEVHISSIPNEGTTIQVEFPLAAAPAHTSTPTPV
jgi:signal transduction histidine kinase